MRILFIGVLFALVSSTAYAQLEGFSLGGNIIGNQISSEYELSEKASVRLDLGFVISDVSTFTLNPELHFHKGNNAVNIGEAGIMMPYHGPGLVIVVGDVETVVAAEFVWGLEFDITDMPFEVFIDAGPYIQFDPTSAIALSSSFGVRYKF
ncbi:MAG: hypothetical protein JJ895_07825 [Balneolaceae bacterium]|nr:hypothetical protein [Balneolaceae bacterium]